jgi:hypothetical protein
MIFTYWSGDPTSNAALQTAAAEWREHWGEFTVFGDDDVLPLLRARGGDRLVDIYRRIRIPACQSDLARLALLHEHGGLYVDAHTGCADVRALGRMFQRLASHEAIVFDIEWLHGHACDMHLCNTVLAARKGSSFVLQLFYEAVNNLYEHEHKEANASAYVPYNVFVLTGAAVVSQHLMLVEPQGKRFNPDYAGRIHHLTLKGDAQDPVTLYKHYGYRAPGMHWSERQNHERLFLHGTPEGKRSDVRKARRRAAPANWGLVTVESAGGDQAAVDHVRALHALKAAGRLDGVALAARTGALADPSAVAATLRPLDVRLIEGEADASALGLLACPEEALVLQAGADRPLSASATSMIGAERLRTYERRVTPKSFGRPVWVAGGRLSEPLLLERGLAYGRREDLLRIAAAQGGDTSHLAAHAERFPTLRLYDRLTRTARREAGELVYEAALRRTSLWWRAMAISARLVIEDYLIGDAPEEEVYAEATFDAFRKLRLGDLLSGEALGPGLERDRDGAVRFHSAAWAMAAREGWFQPDEPLERFRAAYAAIRSGDTLTDNPVDPPTEAVEFAETMAETLPGYVPGVALRESAGGWRKVPAAR